MTTYVNQRWIPTSERLPNLDDYAGSRVWQKKVLITGYLSFDNTKELFVSEVFAEDVIYNNVHDTVVIAWMPLPEPYDPQESEVERMKNKEISDAVSYIKSYRKFDEYLYNTALKGSVSFYATEKCLHYWDMAIEALESQSEDKGEISDGYHTFNQLYHQRAVLFATIVNQNKDRAWKSWKHEDGKYCFDSNGEWFIVGVDTPQGSYTYHYSKEYWDMFKCQTLECGKHWDGHTEEDVIRLLSLESRK